MSLADTITEAYKTNNIDLVIASFQEIDNCHYQNPTYKIIDNNVKQIYMVKCHTRNHDPGIGGRQGNGRYVKPQDIKEKQYNGETTN